MLHTTIQNQASVYLFPVAGDGEVEQKHRECQQLGDGEENTLALLKSIASLFIFCSLMVAIYIPQTQNAGQGDWFYPVILSGILPCPPMRITKLRAKVGQKSGIANFSVNLRT